MYILAQPFANNSAELIRNLDIDQARLNQTFATLESCRQSLVNVKKAFSIHGAVMDGLSGLSDLEYLKQVGALMAPNSLPGFPQEMDVDSPMELPLELHLEFPLEIELPPRLALAITGATYSEDPFFFDTTLPPFEEAGFIW